MQYDQRRIQEPPVTESVAVLPFPADSDPVGALQPAQVVSGLIALQVPGLKCVNAIAHSESVEIVYPYLRAPEASAADIRRRAVGRGGYVLAINDVLEVKAKVIDQPAGQCACQPALDVIVSAGVFSPVRRQTVVCIWSEGVVIVAAVSSEDAVLVIDLGVHPDVEEISFVWAGRYGVELAERTGLAGHARYSGGLIKPLYVSEKEGPVFFDGTSERSAVLIAPEERVKIGRVSEKARHRRDRMISKVQEPTAVVLVGPRARYYIYRANRGDPRRQVKVECRDLELLNRFCRKVLRGAAAHGIENAASVHGQPRQG